MTTVSLVGAQWGSEGKGVIAGGMAARVDAAVRVGGPNAGHSLYHKGELFKMRSVPCAWVNPRAMLVIGAGAVVNPTLLERELLEIKTRTEECREVFIDPRAVIIMPEMEHAERDIVASIGSTGEGVGQARIARISRKPGVVLAMDFPWSPKVKVTDTAEMLNGILSAGGTVMVEGTQGSGLSLLHGTEYPKVTSADTNVSGMLSEAGIAPSLSGHVHLVARTFPIRVAGPSGPMGEELSWDWFIEQGIVTKPEQTTVTLKTRRISRWYDPVVDRAVMLNRPCGIWLTFGDYLAPELRGSDDPFAVRGNPAILSMIHRIEERHHVPVLGVGMGPGGHEAGYPDFMVAHMSPCSHGDSWDW